MMNMYKRWSQEEVKILRKHFPVLGLKVISKLDRSISGISKKVYKLKIRSLHLNYRRNRLKKNITLNEDVAYIFGVLLGDGFFRESKGKRVGIGLATKDKEFADCFKSKLQPLFSKVHFQEAYRDNKFFCDVYSADLIEFLKDFGFEDILNGKNSIKNGRSVIKIAFLKGLYDSEGHVTKGKVGFTNTNKKIIDIISDMLNGFGIKHGIYSHLGSSFNPKCLWYQLVIYRRECRKRFLDLIGFTILRKQNRLIEEVGGNN